MKTYTKKTLEECLEEASAELNLPKENLLYNIEEEKKGLFSKKVTISVVEISDVIEYAENYVKNVCSALGFEVSLKTFYRDDAIKILIETNNNSGLIGRNGTCLASLNELVKLAVSTKFKKKFRILLDVGNYKEKKYFKVIMVAKKAAKEVSKTHVAITLDPMTPDERKKVHNALSTWKNIKTESVGDGKNRRIVVSYDENSGASTPAAESSADNESVNKD